MHADSNTPGVEEGDGARAQGTPGAQGTQGTKPRVAPLVPPQGKPLLRTPQRRPHSLQGSSTGSPAHQGQPPGSPKDSKLNSQTLGVPPGTRIGVSQALRNLKRCVFGARPPPGQGAPPRSRGRPPYPGAGDRTFLDLRKISCSRGGAKHSVRKALLPYTVGGARHIRVCK